VGLPQGGMRDWDPDIPIIASPAGGAGRPSPSSRRGLHTGHPGWVQSAALQGAYENLNNNAAYPYPLCLGGLTHRHKAAIDQP